MTGGAVEDIALYYGVCMDCNASAAYAEGQQAGRVASTTVSTIEEVTGTVTTVAALAAIPPTAGGGLVCTAITAGLCALPVGGAVAVEGAIAVGGAAIAGSGAATMAYIRANPVQGPRYTAGNFRKNLENRTRIPAGMRNPEAHHVLPQALEAQFSRLGINNINDPQWGAWVEGGTHQRWSHAYQVGWENWLQNNPNATLAEIKAQASTLAQQFGYTWP